jgi:hypothetical protein
MTVNQLYTVREHRGRRRIYLEGKRLWNAKFFRGSLFNIAKRIPDNAPYLSLIRQLSEEEKWDAAHKDGFADIHIYEGMRDYKVSGRTDPSYEDGNKPTIDLSGSVIPFPVGTEIEITYSDWIIEMTYSDNPINLDILDREWEAKNGN